MIIEHTQLASPLTLGGCLSVIVRSLLGLGTWRQQRLPETEYPGTKCVRAFEEPADRNGSADAVAQMEPGAMDQLPQPSYDSKAKAKLLHGHPVCRIEVHCNAYKLNLVHETLKPGTRQSRTV